MEYGNRGWVLIVAIIEKYNHKIISLRQFLIDIIREEKWS